METERDIKKRIEEKLRNAPKFYLYCSACSAYLCCSTTFTKYLVHWDCRNKPIRYYNAEDNPPPEDNFPRH